MKKTVILLFFLILLGGCGKSQPLDEDQMNFVGNWFELQGSSSITIFADGKASLYYQSEGTTLSMQTANVTVNRDELRIKFLFFGKTFTINQAPVYRDGMWSMILDDTEFVRKGEPEL